MHLQLNACSSQIDCGTSSETRNNLTGKLESVGGFLPAIQASLQVDKATVVPLEEAKTETCGSKSAACAQLARLAAKGSSFATAAGVCLPFGNMEAAIKVTFHAGSLTWRFDNNAKGASRHRRVLH